MLHSIKCFGAKDCSICRISWNTVTSNYFEYPVVKTIGPWRWWLKFIVFPLMKYSNVSLVYITQNHIAIYTPLFIIHRLYTFILYIWSTWNKSASFMSFLGPCAYVTYIIRQRLSNLEQIVYFILMLIIIICFYYILELSGL